MSEPLLPSDPHFGYADKPLPDWRNELDEPDPDDEELEETPADVILILGFDPKDL
jgi:hypothetical protein